MANSLDERLGEIKVHIYQTTKFGKVKNEQHGYLCEESLAQIKQVFSDEGYSTPVDKDGIINFGTEEQPILIHKDSLPFSNNSGGYIDIPKDLRLTGAEWLARFEKEISSIFSPDIDDWKFTHLQVIEAAKRAAGLDGEEKTDDR